MWSLHTKQQLSARTKGRCGHQTRNALICYHRNTHRVLFSPQDLRHQRVLCHCGYFRHAWQRRECAALPESLLLSPLRHLRARQTFLRSEARTSARIWNMTGNISCDLWIVTQTVSTIQPPVRWSLPLFWCHSITLSARSPARSLHHPLCLYSESCTLRVCLSFKLDRLFMRPFCFVQLCSHRWM